MSSLGCYSLLLSGILLSFCCAYPSEHTPLPSKDENPDTLRWNSRQSSRVAAEYRSASSFSGRFRNAFSYPEECEYDEKTYNCTFGASCWWQGHVLVNLCGGGLIWSCCVPREEYRKVPPALDNIECGTRPMAGGRIVEGSMAKFGDHPWQVALVSDYYAAEHVFCGGALISEEFALTSEEFALTAAHCVARRNESRVAVRLGEYNIKGETELYPHEDLAILRKIVHEHFGWTEGHHLVNDIALLQLAKPVVFRKHIVPICLPTKGANFAGEMGTVSGWGRMWSDFPISPARLREVKIPVVSNDDCQKWYAEGGRNLTMIKVWLCAGFKTGGKDSCTGDSGGPLIVERDGRAELVGLVSFGFSCGLPNAPGIYTNVSNFVHWIEANMRAAIELRLLHSKYIISPSPAEPT